MFFENINYVILPKSKNKVIFQCDQNYFENYGFFNLLSCDKVGYDVHLHLINPSKEFLNRVCDLKLDIDLSISIESLDTHSINFYKLKSYYFCSRYFITDKLFEDELIDSAIVTDADIIFNEKLNIPSYIDLSILYYPKCDNLWKQTGANVSFVTRRRKDFIKKIIVEYKKKLQEINFEIVSESMEKFQRANMYGLDQVCMSLVMQNEDTSQENFLNLCDIKNLISKDDGSIVWSFTGKSKKDPNLKSKLESKFKKSF